MQQERHVADFVKEQRAAVALLELADAFLVRAGKGSFFMAKEFAFEQRVRNRRAVHRQERAVAALAVLIDRAGDEFLARPAFAADQDGDILRRDAADRFVNGLHGRTAADDSVADFGRASRTGHRDRDVHQAADFERLLDQRHQHAKIQRLHHKIIGTKAHRLDRDIAGIGGGDKNHRHLVVERMKLAKRFQTVHIAQHDVEQNDAGLLGAQHSQAIVGRGRFDDRDVCVGERFLDQVAHGAVVVDDQYLCPSNVRHVSVRRKR